MIKVMLVDDEPAILNGIKKTMTFIEKVEVVATAYNGHEAMEAMETCRPDLIITDIRMPIMTGLELIGQVNKKYPDTICILLSGYSEFEYAREALRLKVFDYLLKPVSIEKLAEVIGLIEDRINEKTMRSTRKIIESLVNSADKLMSHSNIFPKIYEYYYVIHICAGPISIPSLDLIFPDLDIWTEEAIFDHIVDLFDDRNQLFVVPGKISNEKWLVFGIDTEEITLIRNITRRLMAHFITLSSPVTLSVSEPINEMQSISKEARKVRDYAFKKIVIGKPRILIQNDREVKEQYMLLSQQDEILLRRLSEKRAFTSISETLRRIFEKWKLKVVTENMCAYSIKRILSSLMTDSEAETDQQAINDLFYEVDVVVSSSINYEELYEGIEQLIQSFVVEKRDYDSTLNIQQSIDQIEMYIQSHYAEPISSEKLSEIFGYNPIYLSSTFCCMKGISPNKLIKKMRVDKAKTLLVEQPDMLLKDVAQIVGYDDALYFSRVFKSMTDLSPSEYKKSMDATQ